MIKVYKEYKRLIIIGAIILGITWSVGLLLISYNAEEEPPLTDVQIPAETKEYLRKISETIADIRFIIKEGTSKNRTNREDDKEADEYGFLKVASENFLVYYRCPYLNLQKIQKIGCLRFLTISHMRKIKMEENYQSILLHLKKNIMK